MDRSTAGGHGESPTPGWVLAALDALPQATVLVFDRDLRFVLARGAALGPTGYGRGILEGQLAEQALPADRWALYERPYRDALEGRSSDLTVTAPDGRRIFSVRISPVRDDDGEVIGGISVATDVSSVVEAEERYRLLAENASDIVLLTDSSGQITWVSPSVAAVLGWDPDDLVGRAGMDYVFPGDRMAAGERRRMLSAAGETDAGVLRFLTADGDRRWMAIKAHAVPDSSGVVRFVVIALRDVEDEVSARRRQAESERLFRTTIASAPIGMCLMTLDGDIELVNDALCLATGRDEGWLLSHHAEDYVDPADHGLLAATMDALATGEPMDPITVRVVRPDGSRLWVRRAATVISGPGGQPERILVQTVDVTVERERLDDLARRAFHDQLTGIRNRAWILDMLDLDLRTAAREGHDVGVLMIDLDRFKAVNDALGHAAGDELLVAVAQRLDGERRPGDRVARFGGDEFLVVIPQVSDMRALEAVADRIIESIQRDVQIRGTQVTVGASIGIAVSTPTSTRDQLVQDADSALFRAKFAGRGRWHFADASMHEWVLARVTLEQELGQAVTAGQIVVHFQPVVRLHDGSVVGHEAMIRWEHRDRGMLMPAEFLPLAEASGLMPRLGDLVLDRTLSHLASAPADWHCSVNVSPSEVDDPAWARRVLDRLDQAGIAPDRLIVEITEQTALGLSEDNRAALRELADRGVGLYVDDFGTGISSLSALRELPLTGIKLDCSLTDVLARVGSPSTAVAAGLAGLAEGLGVVSVAEGVETEAQRQLLLAQGWQFGQGYLFGAPAPGAQPGPAGASEAAAGP